MKQPVFYFHGNNAALDYTARHLHKSGHTVVLTPGPDVTHLVLPVPSFEEDGRIKGGGSIFGILAELPEDVIVIGGNLTAPILKQYRCVDLLEDITYVTQNAAITAQCTIKLLLNKLPVTLEGQKILIIGWGRIGKCLARLLRNLDAHVTIAARKSSDNALIAALGYDTANLSEDLSSFQIVVNTAPVAVLSEAQISGLGKCLKIDLASVRGIDGSDVIWARGLPGKDAPQSSGQLIAGSILRLI